MFSFWLTLIDPFLFPCETVFNCPGREIGAIWYLRTVVFTNFSYATNLCDVSLEG